LVSTGHRVAAVEPLELDAAGLVRHQRVQNAPEAPAAPARRGELRRAHLRREGGTATHFEIGDAHEAAPVVVARRQPEQQIGDAGEAALLERRGALRANPHERRHRARQRLLRELRRSERREPLERRGDRAGRASGRAAGEGARWRRAPRIARHAQRALAAAHAASRPRTHRRAP
jgi:hypothetical protein